MKTDTVVLLHELMYRPRGNIALKEIRRHAFPYFNNEARVVLIHCAQNSFIEVSDRSIQLTDCGLDYYLKNVNSLT